MRRGLIARLFHNRAPEAGITATDADLLARFVGSGDEAAFELLVWRHAALVFGVCRRVIGDEHRAEDAFQASFLVLARKAGSVRGAKLAGWLFRVARRVALRARKQAVTLAGRESSLVVEPPSLALPHPVENRELAAVLDEEIAALPSRLQRVIVLCYLGGHTTEEAARLLGCPRGTVLSRLATARQRLVARLTRRGIGLGMAGVAGLAGVPEVAAVAVVVPKAVRLALGFAARRTGPVLGPPGCFLLAEGVLRTMQTGKILTAVGLFVVTVGLACGVGAVTAQPATPERATAKAVPPEPQPTPKPGSSSPAQRPPTDDLDRARDERENHLRRLSDLAGRIQQEIDVHEDRIARFEQVRQGYQASVARTRKLLDEVELEIARTEIDRADLEAELLMTSRQLEANKLSESNLESTRAATESQQDVRDALQALTEKRAALAKMKASAADPTAPAVAELQKEVDRLSKNLDQIRSNIQSTFEFSLLQRMKNEQINNKAILKLKIQAIDTRLEVRKTFRNQYEKILNGKFNRSTFDSEVRNLEHLRESLAQIERERIRLQIEQTAPSLIAPTGDAARSDAILAELRLLRREVAELRKGLQQPKSP